MKVIVLGLLGLFVVLFAISSRQLSPEEREQYGQQAAIVECRQRAKVIADNPRLASASVAEHMAQRCEAMAADFKTKHGREP